MSDSLTSTIESAKEAAAQAAVRCVRDGMVLGLGTGSTAAHAISAIGERCRTENLDLRGVATSFASERLAREAGIPLTDLSEVDAVDLAIDGADEITPQLDLIKGRGAAHTRERVVAADAREFVVVGDYRKMVPHLGGTVPVPVEVVPMAVRPVMRRLVDLGGDVEVREGGAKDGPVVTDQGLWVLDVRFGAIEEKRLRTLADAIKGWPGVLDHGLFVGLASRAFVGQEDGSVRELESGS